MNVHSNSHRGSDPNDEEMLDSLVEDTGIHNSTVTS